MIPVTVTIAIVHIAREEKKRKQLHIIIRPCPIASPSLHQPRFSKPRRTQSPRYRQWPRAGRKTRPPASRPRKVDLISAKIRARTDSGTAYVWVVYSRSMQVQLSSANTSQQAEMACRVPPIMVPDGSRSARLHLSEASYYSILHTCSLTASRGYRCYRCCMGGGKNNVPYVMAF